MTITSYWGTSPSLVSHQPGWVTPTGAELATPPGELDPDVFRTWTRAEQLGYIQANGGGPLEIGPPLKSVTVSVAETNTVKLQLDVNGNPGDEFTVQSFGRAATPTEMATPPNLLDPRVFMAWSRADQTAYVEARGTGNPPSVKIGDGPWLPGAPVDPDKPRSPIIYASAVPDVTIQDGVLSRSSGDYQPRPNFFLPGSAEGAYSKTVAETARALFPSLDGVSARLAVEKRPDTFYITPDMLVTDEQKRFFLDSFSSWHSALQLEYVKQHGTGGVLDIAVATPSPRRMTAVASESDPTRLFIVQSLQKHDFARMTAAEQRQVAATDAFATVGPALGLIAATDPAAQELRLAIDQLISDISNPRSMFNVATVSPATGGHSVVVQMYKPADPPPPDPYTGVLMKWEQEGHHEDDDVPALKTPRWVLKSHHMAPLPDDAKVPFISQLEILKEQIGLMGVLSVAEIEKQSNEIKGRFDRAFAFFDVKAPTATSNFMGNPWEFHDAYRDVITQDGRLDGIQRGFQTFIAQEEQIAQLAQARMQAVRENGMLHGATRDAPSLVFLFQELYSRAVEAEVGAETEEINQHNDLLRTYAAMQDVINRTLGSFEKADDTRKRLLDGGWDSYASYPTELRMLLGMFEDHTGNGQRHPLERLRDDHRPTMDFIWQVSNLFIDWDSNYDLNRRTHMEWDRFNSVLSQNVAAMNQNIQIKMNDVNSMDKQRNRHFELANNALSKLYDTLAKIARA